jgi:hypothetical protein
MSVAFSQAPAKTIGIAAMPQDEEAVIGLSYRRHVTLICAGWDATSGLQ